METIATIFVLVFGFVFGMQWERMRRSQKMLAYFEEKKREYFGKRLPGIHYFIMLQVLGDLIEKKIVTTEYERKNND